MKNRDLKNYIRKSTQNFAPDFLAQIMERPVEPLPKKPAPARERRILIQRFAAAFAVLVILIAAGFGGYRYVSGETGIVYFDINPSMALTINKLGRVSSIEYFNQEAEALFVDYRAEGKKPQEVLEYYLSKADEAGYFDEADAQFYLSVYADKSATADKLLTSLNTAASGLFANRGIHAEVNRQTCNAQEKNRAQTLHISAGKLKVIETIQSEDPAYSVEELRDRSMSELKSLLRSLNEENNGEENGGTGNGSNNDNGNGSNNGNGHGKR